MDKKNFIQLLPGEYSASVVSFLVNMTTIMNLTSHTPIVPTPGYNLSSAVPPFNITLQPGFTTFLRPLYDGPTFTPILKSFANRTTSLDHFFSIAIAPDVFLAISYGVSEYLYILYDTAPVITFITLPPTNQRIILKDFQSSTCQPACTSYGVCIASGKCVCDKGFTGSACELCASGFYGTACKPCPSPCKEGCDQNGKCLTPKGSNVRRAQNKCICQNGQCIDGKCVCLPGWTGSTCDRCAQGFSLVSTDDTTNSTNCQCKIPIFLFFPTSDCSQHVNLDALTAMITRESAVLAMMLTARIQMTIRSAKYRQLRQKTRHVRMERSVPKIKDAFLVRGRVVHAMVRRRRIALVVPIRHPCTKAYVLTWILRLGFVQELTEWSLITIKGCVMVRFIILFIRISLIFLACGANCTECEYENYSQNPTFNLAKCKKCSPGTALSDGKCSAKSCPDGQFISGGSCQSNF